MNKFEVGDSVVVPINISKKHNIVKPGFIIRKTKGRSPLYSVRFVDVVLHDFYGDDLRTSRKLLVEKHSRKLITKDRIFVQNTFVDYII